MATRNDSTSSTVDSLSMPRASGRSSHIAMTATAGTVRPIQATALLSARLMLDCYSLRRAARREAANSGNSTIAATSTPAPFKLAGVLVAAIVLLPELAASLRAARRNELQSSINLALGSAVACIGLTVPAVAVIAIWLDRPLALGIDNESTVLLVLSFLVAMLTYGQGRTNLLSGFVHLVLLACYVFLIFAP